MRLWSPPSVKQGCRHVECWVAKKSTWSVRSGFLVATRHSSELGLDVHAGCLTERECICAQCELVTRGGPPTRNCKCRFVGGLAV